MYIASKNARKWPELSDSVPELDKERRQFIRAAAIQLVACESTCETAWITAQRLWGTRPEDCYNHAKAMWETKPDYWLHFSKTWVCVAFPLATSLQRGVLPYIDNFKSTVIYV